MILDDESVRTRFLVVGPFMVPLEMFYVAGRDVLPVRWHIPSVLLAYARWVVAPLAVLIAFIASTRDDASGSHLQGNGFWATASLVVVWLILVFRTGRSTGQEARQRRALAEYAGHGAPPEMLTEGAARDQLEQLEGFWPAAVTTGDPFRGASPSLVSWREMFPKDVPRRALLLYYALCRYEAAVTGEMIPANRARLAWQRIDEARS
jgi:hypothetical protein